MSHVTSVPTPDATVAMLVPTVFTRTGAVQVTTAWWMMGRTTSDAAVMPSECVTVVARFVRPTPVRIV